MLKILSCFKRFVLDIALTQIKHSVYNRVMSNALKPQLEADRALIQALGGPTQRAKLLGLSHRGSVQRVQNGTVRGIPPAVKLAHPQVFLRDLVNTESST